MLRKTAIFMMLCATVQAQQFDKPAVQDLADQGDAARSERAEKLKVIGDAETKVRDKLGPQLGEDYRAEAPLIHLRVMECLVKGDYSRRISKIYADAANAAAKEAKEAEAKAGVSMAPAPEAVEARQSLEEAVRREAELRAKPIVNGVEKAELDGMPGYKKQLTDTIEIYERIVKSPSNAARSSDMARQMSEKEALFRLKAKQSDTATKFYNAQCRDEFALLKQIDQAERDELVLKQYDRLSEGQAVPTGAVGRGSNAVAPTHTDSISDTDKLKEDERILSDPDEMLKLANHLKQLSGQGSPN